ncbi:hypothetical protein BYT27DRAFT_7215660 [Phlegmacium glaucopus]|nr:hypothetical protein BYT27DRAFT_7215660 [Phlegmacium glaucopus]
MLSVLVTAAAASAQVAGITLGSTYDAQDLPHHLCHLLTPIQSSPDDECDDAELYTPPHLPPGIRPDCPESWRNPPGIQEFLVNEKIPHGFRVDSGWIPGIPI